MPLHGDALKAPVRIADLLAAGLAEKPDETALASAQQRWSWRQFDAASARLAGNLLELGLKPGDRVASLMPNRTALLVHYLACIKAGLVSTPLNYRYMAPEIDHALKLSEAAVLLAHAERGADIAASKEAAKLPLGVIAFGAGDGRSPSFEELAERDPKSRNLPASEPSAPAFIFFTSGSTGPAKGVTHTLESLGWIAASLAKSLEFTPSDTFLTASSLSHEGGVGCSFAALSAGARVVVGRTFDGDELLPLLRDERPSVVWMLPTTLIALVRDHGATRNDFASLRYCTTGGDKTSLELDREFTDLAGFEIHESYGMTEVGGVALNPPSGVNKLGSIGPLCAGFEASIRDDTGAELPEGSEGRLWIKSPSNMIGYWNDPEATKATIREGWLDSGDVMRADADGYLWFCGRKKQIIVHDGSNISPQEVEGALLEHPAVESAGVVGVHDLVHGENVRAYITLRKGAKRPASQDLIRFARARIGYKAPEEIVVLRDMPVTPVGKLDRAALKRMAAEPHSADGQT